jgi:hypothetical protein
MPMTTFAGVPMRTTAVLVPVIILLSACDGEILSPNRNSSSVNRASAKPSDAFTLSASPMSASAINVGWNDVERDESGWEVHRSTTGASGTFTLRSALPANSTMYDDVGLTMMTEYCYKVRSWRKQGPNTTLGKFSNTSCTTTLGPPRVPTGVNAIPRSSWIVDVQWTFNGGMDIRVERSALPGGPWATAATLPWSSSAYTDYSPVPDAQVCYRIVASNEYGESASSTDCTAPPRGVPSITASSQDAQTIDVTWTDASSVEDGYEVQRALSDNAFSTIANLSANTSGFRDGSVARDTRYQYRVRAKRDGGFSDFSPTAFAAVPSTRPAAPNALDAYPGGSTHAILLWASLPATVVGIRIQRSTDAQATWVDAGSISGGQTSFADGGRVPEQEVCYRMFAFNALGESGPSNVECTILPLNPSDMRLEPQDEWSYVLTFTDRSSVEDGFVVRIGTCGPAGCRFRDIELPASPSGGEMSLWLSLEPDEFIEVYAYHDGGLSDQGIWAQGASSPARLSDGRSFMKERRD